MANRPEPLNLDIKTAICTARSRARRYPLLGDYNGDSTVNAADYVVWRKGLGTTYTQSDYDVWRTHFGQTASSGSSAIANAAVPEPATMVLLVFAAADWWAINSKRIERERANFFRQTRREIVKTLKEEEVTDDQGRTIPRRAAIRIKGDKHQSRWFDFLAAKPRKALTALAQQRRSLVAYARKIKIKRESYNDNNQYGAELPLFDFNLNKDLRDAEQPTVWPEDAPNSDD